VLHVDEFNGHFYTYDSVSLNFSNALAAASAKTPINGLVPHLAIITSADENTFLKNMFGSSPGLIGVSDLLAEGTFRYVTGPETGSVLTYTAWASGEPNNGGGAEHCVVSNNGAWNDVPCSITISGYFTEYDCPGVLIPGAYGCICKTCA
jgi:hypothetical protein